MKKYPLMMMACFMLIALPAQAATITGKIVYEGDVPKLRPLKMDADPICAAKHTGGEILPQTLVLGEDKTMGNVFVYLKEGVPNKKFPVPAEPAVLTQEGCVYHPHVMGVMAGQELKILNPDGTLHNVHALPKINQEFNLAMPKFRKELTKVFDKPEFMFPVKCDVHPWMGAWISVMAHPYFTTTEADGLYTLTDVPPGNYVLAAWHERLGEQTVNITVSGDDTKEADFTFARPGQ